MIITSKSNEITNEGLNPADIAVGHFGKIRQMRHV